MICFLAVLLFLYLLHKLGIFGCLGRTVCKMMWTCFSCCFHVCEYSCTFLCVKLQRLKRKRRKVRNQKFYSTTGEDYTDESLSYHFPVPAEISRSFSSRRRGYRGSHLRKSLGPRNYHSRVEISRNLSYYKNKRNHSSGNTSHTSNAIKHDNHKGTVHDIKVTRTSKFARKGVNNRKRVLQRQRR